MDYYQTEVYWPSTKEWISASEIIPLGKDNFKFITSKKLTHDQVDEELKRLRTTYRHLTFERASFSE